MYFHIEYHTIFLSRTWDKPREVVSARARRVSAETTRGSIPGPRTKKTVMLFILYALNKSRLK